MKNKELNGFFKAMTNAKHLRGVKFAYALVKNMEAVGKELKRFAEISEPSPEYKAYDLKRVKLCESFSEKGDDGNPIVDKGEYLISDKEAFNTAAKELIASNQEAYDKRIKQFEELNLMMDEESEVKIFKVKFEALPEDIAGGELLGLSPMIDD